MANNKPSKLTPLEPIKEEKVLQRPGKEEPEVITDERRAFLDFKRALEKENAEKFRCPNCKAWMSVTASGKYLHHGGTQSDYSKWECDDCGYILHSYLPLPDGIREMLDDFPF